MKHLLTRRLTFFRPQEIAALAAVLCFLVAAACQQKNRQATQDTAITAEWLARGEQVYLANCAACHRADGQGNAGMHPPLNQTPWVVGNKERLIKVALHGLQERIVVHGQVYEEPMPGFAHLSDQELADVLSYVRSSFGNEASLIRVEEVAKVRAGESLGEATTDFAQVSPSTDYKKIKEKGGSESRVGEFYKQATIDLESIHLPKGFKIEIFAEGLENPRSLAVGPEGTVFVGTRRNQKEFVYALRDEDGDGRADRTIQIERGLKWNPMGVAMRGPDLYVGEIDRILRYRNIEAHLDNPPEPELVFAYPPEKKHGEKYIQFGPDGMLYVPVGAPCNICLEENPVFASITRVSPEGENFEVFAHGVRNSRGFDWHPQTGELWFSDNGRDHLGDDIPPCEVNRAPEVGMHFGYPFCHGDDIADPTHGDQRACDEFTPPVFGLVAHAAPVSLKFYTGQMFPPKYRNQILVSEHGSWNRAEKQGYRVMLLTLEGNRVVSYEPFLTGWLNPSANDAWGRPADLLVMPDGALLLSDDHAGAVYRISYRAPEGLAALNP